MTLRDFIVSCIRTAVPAGVGLVLAHFGINALDIAGVPLQTVVTAVVIMAYYSGVRALEAKWPKVGILLGWTVAPTYAPPTTGGRGGTSSFGATPAPDPDFGDPGIPENGHY